MSFAAALPGAEAAVFFYSGHGMQIDGSNFLLPVDVEATSERSVRYGSIDISEVVRDMETNAEVAIVVLDACRDNPFAAQLQQCVAAVALGSTDARSCGDQAERQRHHHRLCRRGRRDRERRRDGSTVPIRRRS